MNIGIIGAGRIGQVYAKSIMGLPNVRIRSLADPYMTKETTAWADAIGIGAVYRQTVVISTVQHFSSPVF